ncbi:MAG: cytochrome c, partial [Candidatus Eremiobacteraeota bacterium]|nr:cytochrome c [Candidatus Eremiobacteraeota bacterium]
TEHGNMLAHLHIDSQADFGRWLAAKAKDEGAKASPLNLSAGVAERGRALFGQKCSTCHSTGPFDQKIVGPGLGRVAGDPAHPKLVTGKEPTAQYIADILDKGYDGPDLSSGKENAKIGVMPNRQANALTNQDIGNLTAYLLSLSKK